MKRIDPATDLAERAIRQWQLRDATFTSHRSETAVATRSPQVLQSLGLSPLTVGSVAGFLGAIASLLFNIAGAFSLGIEPLRLLRVYATIIEGGGALESQGGFFISAFVLHIIIGIVLGVVFAFGARRACCARLRTYIWVGSGYGVAVWLVNFYGILSWLQPLLQGSPFIVTEIPSAVAVLTHVSYGLIVALITYAFQSDFEEAK